MNKTRLLSSAAAVLLAATAAANAQSPAPDSRRDGAATTQAPSTQTPASRTEDAAPARSQDSQSSQSTAPARSGSATGDTAKSDSKSDSKSDRAKSDSSKPDASKSTAQSPSPSDKSQPSTAQQQRSDSDRSTQSQGSSTERSRSSAAQSDKTDKSSTDKSSGSAQSGTPASRQSAQPSRAQPGQSGSSAQAPAASGQSGTQSSVQLNSQQQTRISTAITSQRVAPVTNVNFSISVGTVVPRSVHVHTLPAEIVTIVPQYRGYSYFVTEEQIVIVEPRTYKIVTVLPYSGSSRPQRSTSRSTSVSESRRAPKFTSQQREVIKKQVVQRPARSTTTVTVGEMLPETVEIEEFPETVYREVPEVRSYRYYRTEDNVVLVDPTDRRVIEIIE